MSDDGVYPVGVSKDGVPYTTVAGGTVRLDIKTANDVQHGGDHYQRGSGKCPHCGGVIQHWDIVRMFNLDYFIGNATKYLFRLGLKGDPKEQLDKAGHYIDKKKEEYK